MAEEVKDTFNALVRKISVDMEQNPRFLSKVMRSRAVAVLQAAMSPTMGSSGKTLDVQLALKAAELFLKYENKLLGISPLPSRRQPAAETVLSSDIGEAIDEALAEPAGAGDSTGASDSAGAGDEALAESVPASMPEGGLIVNF